MINHEIKSISDKAKYYSDSAEFSMLSNSCGTLRSHGETIAWIKNGSVFFPKDHTGFCELVWNDWFNKGECVSELTERKFSENVVSYMDSIGFSCEREVRTKLGRIDILARNKDEVRIIECKIDSSVNSMSSALGQLLFYRSAYKEASLFVAVPNMPSNEVVELFADFGITCFVIGE